MNKKEITRVRETQSSCSHQMCAIILGRSKDHRWNVSSDIRLLSSNDWSLCLCLVTVSRCLANDGKQFFVSRTHISDWKTESRRSIRLASMGAFKAWLHSISWTRESVAKWQQFFSGSSRFTYVIGGSHFDSVPTDNMPTYQDVPPELCIKEQSQISSTSATITNSAIHRRMNIIFLSTIILLLVIEARLFSSL